MLRTTVGIVSVLKTSVLSDPCLTTPVLNGAVPTAPVRITPVRITPVLNAEPEAKVDEAAKPCTVVFV